MSDQKDHKERMQSLKEEQKRKTQEAKDADRGLILVYTGNGKGKSSSAFGVTARALGWGRQVGVVQFIKGSWKTGEKQFFDRFPDQLEWKTMGEGFTWDTQDKERDTATAKAAFELALDMMTSGEKDLVVLDEINIAIRYDYLNVDAVLDGLKIRSKQTSVILTGRDAAPAICDYADLVTEMREIKHPFSAGIKAMRGIDF